MKIIYSIIISVLAWSIANCQTTNYGTDSGSIGDASTFIGHEAGKANTTIRNTFIGHKSGIFNASGTRNTFLGAFTGRFNTTGGRNVFIGNQAGYKNKTGKNNTFLGSESGFQNVGEGNVFIGFNAGYNETGSNKLYVENSETDTPLIYGDFSTDQIGINTTTIPTDYVMAINGKLIAEEVRVQLVDDWWPDYVFDQDYELMSLEELRAFIKENKHLPEVPTKEDVLDQGGIDVGKMNQILLKKIEELSLYVLSLKAEIDILKN